MSTAAMTPQSTAPLGLLSYNEPKHDERLRLQADPQSSSSSFPSSPELRPVDLRSPIPEEEDETSSEAANEPITPTESHHPHPHTLQGKMDGIMDPNNVHTFAPIHHQPPLILNTAPTPPPSAGKMEDTPVSEQQTPKSPITPLQKRPTTSALTTKDGTIKRGLSGLFKRSNSHNANLQPLTQVDGATLSIANRSDTILGKGHRRLSIRGTSATNSAYTTRSNTPPSPGSPAEGEQKPIQRDPSSEDFLSNNRRKNRSSTGFNLRDKISNTKSKISFAPTEKDPKHGSRRNRATSVDLDNQVPEPEEDPQAKLPPRQIWGMAADAGTGLKSRRMSLSLPDDFSVDVVELYSEFADQSKIVGRRGKHVGRGATANVRLMHRKGCAGEIYAVKEFRGKSTNEKAEDYEQKVKSEYSIAKSVHHPNVVETFRLCTHNGRWNHVMEFCDQGDLFGLVSQKYLSKDDHLVDRLCLFKQLVQGLNYLHTHGIAHRDIKLENLLITKDSKLKITDFGVSEVFAGIHPGLRAAGGQCGKDMGKVRLCPPGMCGSPPYVAPEVIAKKGEYDPRPLDVWGAAIVMLCMTANGVLWQEATPGSSVLYDDLVKGWEKWNEKHADQTSASINETDYPFVGFFDSHIKPPALRRVLLTMLNPDPSKRVSMETVAKNRWLKNVECCQIDTYDEPATTIDASRSRTNMKSVAKVVHHNHLPPQMHLGHRLVRLPGSTDM